MAIVAFFAVPVLVGWFAQAYKERTGALWAFLTVILEIGMWLLADIAVQSTPRLLLGMTPDERTRLDTVFAAGVGLLLMGAIVASLPMSTKGDKD